MKSSLVRKINTGYQLTIPPDFREHNNLFIGSMVSVINEGSRLIIEPFKNRSAALRKLELLFKNAPTTFESISEQEVSDLVRHEIKAARRERLKHK